MPMTYRHFQPTMWDPKGLDLPDHQDWQVCPTIQTRDSLVEERSNFKAALSVLGGESDQVKVVRFGHWGPGWYEIILVDPDNTDGVQKVLDFEEDLKYGLLDSELYSEMAEQEAEETWGILTLRDRIDTLKELGQCILAARHEWGSLNVENLSELRDVLTRS